MKIPKQKKIVWNIFDENIDLEILSKMTQWLVWADISEIIRRVKYKFIENNQYQNVNGKIKIENNITQSDIEKIIREYSLLKKKKVWFIFDDEE
jgi:SpoVK/Ycf46/Vps4 family AAA+-type ATPase